MEALEIRNPAIVKELDEMTANDPAMRDFLRNVIQTGYESSQYNKKYDAFIKTALEARKSGASE